MMTYRIVWQIELEANSPEEAAREALRMQCDPAFGVMNFNVFDEKGKHTFINLSGE